MPYARKLENANVPTPQRIADAAKKALHLGPAVLSGSL
jgi:hypothetical protein